MTARQYSSPETAQAFVDGYDGSMTPQVYALGFDEVYSMAQQGYSLDEIMSNPENIYSHMLMTEQAELAYEAGIEETLQSGGTRGTIEGETERNGDTYGEEKDFLGGYFRRRNAENTERSSISGTAQKENGRSEKTTIKTARGRATFEAVREGELSDKQQRETAIARAYGYDLYHVPQGSEMTLKGYRHTMEQTALVWDDLPIIFVRDGIDVEYVYHELYHLFVNNNQLGKSQLMESLGNQIDYNSAAWQKYEAMCENAYGVDVPHEVICEEITADLCEYAMSGSDKMAGRLTGLMPDEALQELVGEARALFDANRGGEQGEQDYTSRQGTNGASKGFLADEDTALMQTALDAADIQQQTAFLNQELTQQMNQQAMQQQTPQVQELASRYNDASTARTFVAGYDGGLPVDMYQLGFDQVYQMAQQGVDFETAMNQSGTYGNMLTTQQKQLAYQAGAAEFEAEVLPNGGDGGRLSGEHSSGNPLDGSEESMDLGDSENSRGNEIEYIKTSSADEINNWWNREKGYENPPYKPGTNVEEIKLTQNTKFVRVYDGEKSKMYGGWLMDPEDVKGLTPQQIQDKFALPSIPKYICDVEIPTGTTLRRGIANKVPNWGLGGGKQYDLMGQIVGEFKNERLLPEDGNEYE